jgi:circadian clock protein KaiB
LSTNDRPAFSDELWEQGATSKSLPSGESFSIAGNRTRMSRRKVEPATPQPSAPIRQFAQNHRLEFCLYVTRGERASARALANLKTICRDHFDSQYKIEVVDAQKHPLRAQRDGVTATPTLFKRSPEPVWKIVGDLDEDALILAAMKRKPTARRTL